MLFKKKSFVEDRIRVTNHSRSSFSISFRHSGPNGVVIYKFEKDGVQLISRQHRSAGGIGKPCFNERKNWESFKLEFKYLDCLPEWSKKRLDKEIPARIKRLFLWKFGED